MAIQMLVQQAKHEIGHGTILGSRNAQQVERHALRRLETDQLRPLAVFGH